MKIFLLLTSLVTLYACSKHKDDSKQTDYIVKVVAAMDNKAAQQLAYAQLTQEEKSAIWMCHLNGWLESGQLSAEQYLLVQEVIAAITPAAYKDDVSKIEAGNSSVMAILQHKMKQLFTKTLAGKVFGTVSNNFSGNYAGTDISYPVQIDCKCNEGSWVNQCTVPGYGNCIKVRTCDNGKVDCGFLGLFRCNGDCFSN